MTVKNSVGHTAWFDDPHQAMIYLRQEINHMEEVALE
jgi:hypothetical protein